jgi:hypothetical protein
MEQFNCAGQWYHSFDVFDFSALDFAILGLMIRVWEQLANGCHTRPAVRFVDRFFWIESVLARPPVPNACDSGSGVHENSIEVKQNACTLNFCHIS